MSKKQDVQLNQHMIPSVLYVQISNWNRWCDTDSGLPRKSQEQLRQPLLICLIVALHIYVKVCTVQVDSK